jgi:adenylyltransferase/sulfurtransferase
MADLGFTEEQIERYSRHILLQEVGGEGQRRLLDSSALVIGAGGLGSPALLYLAAAGVGRLGVVDADVVDLSNLQRQIIHGISNLAKNKALSAREAIKEINPDCQVQTFSQRLNAQSARKMLKGYDVVLDGSDNFPTRFLVADCCWLERIPLVSAAVLRFEGQIMTIMPGKGNPCYRCFVPQPPPPGLVPSCQEAGVLGAALGVMGSLQAVEALKILLDIGNLITNRLVLYDALRGNFTVVKRAGDPLCPLCGENPTITKLVEYDIACETEPPQSVERPYGQLTDGAPEESLSRGSAGES